MLSGFRGDPEGGPAEIGNASKETGERVESGVVIFLSAKAPAVGEVDQQASFLVALGRAKLKMANGIARRGLRLTARMEGPERPPPGRPPSTVEVRRRSIPGSVVANHSGEGG